MCTKWLAWCRGTGGGLGPLPALVVSADVPPPPCHASQEGRGSEKLRGPAWRPAAQSPVWPASPSRGGLLGSRTWNGTRSGKARPLPLDLQAQRPSVLVGREPPHQSLCPADGLRPHLLGPFLWTRSSPSPRVPDAERGHLVRTEFSADFYKQNPCDPRTREEVNSAKARVLRSAFSLTWPHTLDGKVQLTLEPGGVRGADPVKPKVRVELLSPPKLNPRQPPGDRKPY